MIIFRAAPPLTWYLKLSLLKGWYPYYSVFRLAHFISVEYSDHVLHALDFANTLG